MVRALRRGLHIQRYRQKNMTRDKEKKWHIHKGKGKEKNGKEKEKRGRYRYFGKNMIWEGGGGTEIWANMQPYFP